MAGQLFIEQIERSVTQILITRERQPEIWRVIYRVMVPEDIPIGAWFEWIVQCQLIHPDPPFKAGVAWLWAVELRDGPDQDSKTLDNMMPKGRVGENITDPQHYASTTKVWRWKNPFPVQKGWCIAYRGRARSYVDTPGNHYVGVWDNGGISVKIIFPE
jgi:hypothetical protein